MMHRGNLQIDFRTVLISKSRSLCFEQIPAIIYFFENCITLCSKYNYLYTHCFNSNLSIFNTILNSTLNVALVLDTDLVLILIIVHG